MTTPYASFLGNADPLATLRETPGKVRKLAEQLGHEGVERSLAPDKWSAKEVLCHLADCEISFGFRFRQIKAEDNPDIQPFDQEKWAASYPTFSVEQAIQAFTTFREWNLAFLKTLKAEDMSRTASHPERGIVTLEAMLRTAAGHDLNHIKQLEALSAKQ